jgi:signal transduction histidine kinase
MQDSKSKQFLAFLKSLKFRLILLILIIVTVPGLALAVGILRSYESRAIFNRESEILGQAKILANSIATSEYMSMGNNLSDSTIQAQIDLLTTIYDGRVVIVDNSFRVYHDTYNLDDHKIIIAEEVMRSFRGEDVTHYDEENHYIEMTIPISDPNDESATVIGVMLISVSTDNILINQTYLRKVATIILLVATIAMLFFAILVVLHSLSPLKKISDGIAEVKEGYGEDRLEVNNYTETTLICQRFNEMIARMKVMDDSRQEFVSNVSHELKTPLTSMKVLADSINSMPDAPIELYQEFMGDIGTEIERETKIINDLLALVKMDKSAADVNISSVNINELLEQILKRLQPIADKQQVELVLESFRPVTAEVDELKITLAITNLIENGIKYNRTDGTGWVHVTLNADHQYFYLKVEDSGIGIPEASLEQIYERFYRVDKSHSSGISGTGLGLAITRSCVLMHRGAIKVHSVEGEGTTFDVRIPLNYIA